MRVTDVSDKVIAAISGQDPIWYTKDHIKSTIDNYAQGNVHYRSSEESKREFLKDIWLEVMKVIKIAPKKRPFRAKNNDEFLRRVSDLIQEASGNSFPDGDPFDEIAEKIGRIAERFDYRVNNDYGTDIDDTQLIDILDAAAKKYLHVKDYNAYHEQMWDSLHGDAVHDYESSDEDLDTTDEWDEPLKKYPGGLFGEDPRSARNPWRESLGEALEDYDNKIEIAIANIGQISEEEAKKLALDMSMDDYLRFIIAADKGEEVMARHILNSYLSQKILSFESVAQEMHYLIKTKAAYVISPDFKRLHEMDQRKVLAEMAPSGLQKILANLRGYEYPGTYEMSVFQVQLNEDIIRLIKDAKIASILEISGAAPGAAQQAAAYGGGDDSTTVGGPKKKMARFQNDKGEEEEGEVVSQDSRNTTVRTKKGTKRMANSDVFVSEEILADIVRLSGIKNDIV